MGVRRQRGGRAVAPVPGDVRPIAAAGAGSAAQTPARSPGNRAKRAKISPSHERGRRSNARDLGPALSLLQAVRDRGPTNEANNSTGGGTVAGPFAGGGEPRPTEAGLPGCLVAEGQPIPVVPAPSAPFDRVAGEFAAVSPPDSGIEPRHPSFPLTSQPRDLDVTNEPIEAGRRTVSATAVALLALLAALVSAGWAASFAASSDRRPGELTSPQYREPVQMPRRARVRGFVSPSSPIQRRGGGIPSSSGGRNVSLCEGRPAPQVEARVIIDRSNPTRPPQAGTRVNCGAGL